MTFLNVQIKTKSLLCVIIPCSNKLYFLLCNISIKTNIHIFFQSFSEDEEDATHIIYPAVDPLEEEYARPVFRRGNNVLVHWYYFPDSHDTWAQADLPVTTIGLLLPYF